MIIRKTEEKDIEHIVDIQIGGWRTAYKGIIDDEFLANMNREEKIEKRKKDYTNNNHIVVEDNGEVVGFCRYDERNEKTFSEYDSEIIGLYVRADRKGQGIGRMMVEYVKKDFKEKGKRKMIIWCLKENYPSRGFYKKMGGKIVGEATIEFGGRKYEEVGFGYELQDTVIIREFEPNDAEEVSEIITRNLLEVNAKDYGKEMMTEHAKQFSKEQILETFKDRVKIFVAEKNGEIFGTAGIGEDWSKEVGSYWILTVFVKPETHGQGIARKLIEKIEEFAKEINAKKLTIPASIAGHEFYYKLGYRYKNGKKEINEEGMYIMEKVMKKYNFKQYEDRDFEYLYNMKKECFKWYVEKIYGSWDDEFQRKFLQDFFEEYKEDAKVITLGDEKIGLFTSYVDDKNENYIDLFYIASKYQRKGLGTEILEEQLRKDKENGINTTLKVYKENPARLLYQKLGFEIYEETETHFKMRRTIE